MYILSTLEFPTHNLYFQHVKNKWLLTIVNQSELLLRLTMQNVLALALRPIAAAMQDIVIDIGDNWKIIGYIDFTLTDHTEGAPNTKSDKFGKIVWHSLCRSFSPHFFGYLIQFKIIFLSEWGQKF